MQILKNLKPGIILDDAGPTDTTVRVSLLSSIADEFKDEYICPINHVFTNQDTGIYVAPRRGSVVILGFDTNEQAYIVSSIADPSTFSDLNNSDFDFSSISTDQFSIPGLEPGEMFIKGFDKTSIHLKENSELSLNYGDSFVSYIEDVLNQRQKGIRSSSSSFKHISGEIKRDLRSSTSPTDAREDKLFNQEYDDSLSIICRDPRKSEALTSNFNNSNTPVIRNPALVEDRVQYYEFARDYGVRKQVEELLLTKGDSVTGEGQSRKDQPIANLKTRRDFDIGDSLNQSELFYNNLMERTVGTVVDLYGNILDINRKKIEFDSSIDDIEKLLAQRQKSLRRSIKFHMEINTRKQGSNQIDFNTLGGVGQPNSLALSKWSIDVDGEGLTKINIPASSDSGNIPLLSRYFNHSEEQDDISYTNRDPDRVDVRHMAFGDVNGDGVSIPADYAPQNKADSGEFKYRTAYHDIIKTAKDITGRDAVSSFISNSENTDVYGEQNAGGRSIHANLDGSLELNIGRDSVDNKSLVVDMSGGIVSRVGKDKFGASLTQDLDGDVFVKIGNDAVEGDDVKKNPAFSLYVYDKKEYHKITIESGKVQIESAPNANVVIKSNNDFVMEAKGDMLLNAKTIGMFGSYDSDGNITLAKRTVKPSGEEI